jgi:hypothetical protein
LLLAALARRSRRHFPAATLMLAASCLLTTLPQFFAGGLYSEFTGAPAAFGARWCWTLPCFSHSPDILIPHLCGNLAVLLLMGGFIEAALGSRRFALLSLTTLLGTTLMNVLRSGGEGHGASGIFWGYHAFALLFLIVYFELRGRAALRDALTWIWAFMFAFDFIGIPAMEVFVMKWEFFENFGQTSHLASVVLALPFALSWRKDAEEGVKDMIAGKPRRASGGALPLVLLAAACVLNAGSTAYALARTTGADAPELASTRVPEFRADVGAYAASPPASTRIEELGDRIAVEFMQDMRPGGERDAGHSTFTKDEDISWKAEWEGNRRMIILLSRPPLAGERLRLYYEAAKAGGGSVKVALEYE